MATSTSTSSNLFKIVLIGDAGTGKTQLVNCFINKDPNDSCQCFRTFGIDFVITTVEIDDKTIKAQICDTAGQERFRTIFPAYYRGTSGVMLVYDITNRKSFTNIGNWLRVTNNYSNDVIITLVGNCLEELQINRVVSTEEGRQFAKENNVSFTEVSTDNFEQVNKAFMTLIREMYCKKRSKEDILPKPEEDILPKPAKESIFDRWFPTKKREQTSNAIEKPSNQQKGAFVANLESKQGHQKETQLQSKSRSDSIPKMESKVPGSKENAPSYRNTDEEIDLLSKTIDNLKQENRDQLAQHIRVNQQLQAEKENLEQDKQQLEIDKQQLQHQVLQQQSEIRTLRDQLTAISNRKNHNDSSDDSWKVSHREIVVTQQELGRGGWGVIWVGVFREQKVAVKQMHEAITCQVNLVLLHLEINTMAQLRHPNLLQFIGAVLDHPSGNPMIITEIMDTSLRKAYEDKLLTPSLPVCVGIMRDVAVGLNYLHCLPDPIIHRDVSSANVLLESKGNGKWKTKISDFGSANKAKQAMTKAAGAAVYSAPESLQPVTITGTKRKLTTKMDVFSYGVLLCEVLNCRFPDIDLFPEMLQEMKKRYSSLHKLVCLCISKQAEERPVMKQVIKKLDHSY